MPVKIGNSAVELLIFKRFLLFIKRFHRWEKFSQQFVHRHIHSNPLFCLLSRTSYSFILHQEKSKIVVNLLSSQNFCCQDSHREPF